MQRLLLTGNERKNIISRESNDFRNVGPIQTFKTFTVNLKWQEIKENVTLGMTANNNVLFFNGMFEPKLKKLVEKFTGTDYMKKLRAFMQLNSEGEFISF